MKVNRIKSLRPSDAIWRHRTWSILAQVVACCLTVPSHYLNQCWLIINKVQSHSSGNHFTKDTSAINHWNQFENYLSKFSLKFPRGQWVKVLHAVQYFCHQFSETVEVTCRSVAHLHCMHHWTASIVTCCAVDTTEQNSNIARADRQTQIEYTKQSLNE